MTDSLTHTQIEAGTNEDLLKTPKIGANTDLAQDSAIADEKSESESTKAIVGDDDQVDPQDDDDIDPNDDLEAFSDLDDDEDQPATDDDDLPATDNDIYKFKKYSFRGPLDAQSKTGTDRVRALAAEKAAKVRKAEEEKKKLAASSAARSISSSSSTSSASSSVKSKRS